MKDNEIQNLGTVNNIAQGTQIEGNLNTSSDCRIDGTVRGNIVSKAKIIIGRSGQVQGNITCASIEIEGMVAAETLVATELMSLKASAKLTGNVTVGKIAIEPGAEFSGTCKMQNHRPATTPNVAQPQR